MCNKHHWKEIHTEKNGKSIAYLQCEKCGKKSGIHEEDSEIYI